MEADFDISGRSQTISLEAGGFVSSGEL